ncbi:hypothetical protein B9Z55_003035 [Caenorhabditis nigoni]|uniref:NTF2-like domain-containing protein n=1 Tax=Caenorhabditis nigoni TaxID=1611254 RepID=A0A2G5VNB1_9PELO|nr:hypothetical protein B9Z55_003035 [Caenorhabditis nigoni]
MSPSTLILCLLVGTSWAFIPDDPDFRGDVFAGRQRAFAPSSDTATKDAYRFLGRVTSNMEYQVDWLSGAFQDGFVFKGCKGTYNHRQTVDLLLQLPVGQRFWPIYKPGSAIDNGSRVNFTVFVSGLGPAPIEVNVVMAKLYWQLESAEIADCPKNSFVGFGSIQDPAEDMVKTFLARVTRTIESKDTSTLLGLFQPKFVFNGCKGTYNKQQVVGMLSEIPAGAKFSFALKSAVSLGNSIKYVVAVSGISATPIEAVFMLNKVDQQLEYGNIADCPKRFMRSAQPKDSNAVIQEFLIYMKMIQPSHNKAFFLDKAFDDAFLFKGCHGTYTKAQAVARFTSLTTGAFIDFSLIESKWNKQGQIESTVSVSGPRMDSFKAQLVYCPQRNVLKSGSVPGCPTRRFY